MADENGTESTPSVELIAEPSVIEAHVVIESPPNVPPRANKHAAPPKPAKTNYQPFHW